MSYERDSTVLTVEDQRETPGTPPSPLVKGSGLGLIGMTERFEEVGGTANAGPTPHGWKVTMEIPR